MSAMLIQNALVVTLDDAGTILPNGQILVEGRNTYVHTAEGRPAPLPDLLRERITAYEAAAGTPVP